MYIPVFEIKDSYIIKHKLVYDTSCDADEPFKIMFTDYDLARKSQTTNAENFSGVTIDVSLSGETEIDMKYFGDTYIIYLDGNIEYEDIFSGTTVQKTADYEEFVFASGSSLYGEKEVVEVKIYQKYEYSGTTTWSHYAYASSEVWMVTGTTGDNVQWVVTGTTTSTGQTSGTTDWYAKDIVPIIAYTADVVGTGATYIRTETKLEYSVYNDLLSKYDNLYYTIRSLTHSSKDYYDIYYAMQSSPYGDNFEMTHIADGIVMTPKYNVRDVYFDYSEFQIVLPSTTTYEFETECLYNKYDLQQFFEQLGVDSTESIYEDSNTNVTVSTGYTYGDYYMELTAVDSSYFVPYMYAAATTSTGTTYDVLITHVSGDTITIVTPLNFGASDVITNLQTIYTVGDISDILQVTYENYEHDEYRKFSEQVKKAIYNAYAEIVNKREENQEIRLLITGIVFENEKKIMVLKVFSPADFIDDRLLYEPIEAVRIGKDRKTTIPVPITNFTKGLAADVVDENVYSVYLFDPRIYDVLVIDANAT